MRTAIRLTAAAGILGVLTAVVTGCAASNPPTDAATPRAASSASAAPSESPTPTQTASSVGHGIPLDYSCGELLDSDVVEVFDSHLEVRNSFNPAASSSAEHAVEIRGTACEWIDRTTGASLIVSAAHPDAPTLIDLTSRTASYAAPTSAFGAAPNVFGYYAGQQVEAFTKRGFWITANSPQFTNPVKAQAVMRALLEALPL